MYLDHLLYPANPPRSQAYSVTSSAYVFGVLSGEEAHLACRQDGEGQGWVIQARGGAGPSRGGGGGGGGGGEEQKRR